MTKTHSFEDLQTLDVPRVDQYFGIWAVLEDPFNAAVERFKQLDLQDHLETHMAGGKYSAAGGGEVQAAGGIAVISMSGLMMKTRTSLQQSTSTVMVRRQLRAAVRNPDVGGIVLVIDSPGGTVAGTEELARDVAAAAAQKPLRVQIDDMAASAAFWTASQGSKIYANATALVGGIGTFIRLEDSSGQAAQDGIKVHVVRAGEFKGMAAPGSEITAEQLEKFQNVVNDLNQYFVAGVASGRKLAQAKVSELANGLVHIAEKAQAMGLIDGVQTLDETIQQLRGDIQTRSKGRTRMTTETGANATDTATESSLQVAELHAFKPEATIEQLEAACPGASGDFLLKQIKSKATIDQAQRAFIEHQNQALQAKEKELADAKSEQPDSSGKPAPKANGVEPLSENNPGSQSIDDPQAAWDEAVQSYLDKGMRREKAVAMVARKQPELREAFVAAMNSQS